MRYTYNKIRRSFKNGSSYIAVLLMNYVSVPFIWFFANFTRVSPTQITFIGFCLGLFAGIAFFFNRFLLGAILFELSYVFDCVDGRLARLTNRTSKIGDMYDHFLGQFLILMLILPLVNHYLLMEKYNSIYIFILFSFLSPFNYFVNYFSKYTFMEVYGTSLASKGKPLNAPHLLHRIYLSLKEKGIKPIPSNVEAIHLMFFVIPLLLFFEKYVIVNLIAILANAIFIFEIIISVYRNTKLSRLY